LDDFNIDITYEKPSLATKAKLGIPSILMIIFVFAMSGIGSLLQINFEFKTVAIVSLAGTTAMRMAVHFCTRWVGASARYQRDENSKDVERARDAFAESMTGVDIADFERWAVEENRKEKDRVYRDMCYAEILSLERKIGERKSRTVIRKKDKKFIAKAEKKIEEIRARSTDEFIAENIPYIKVVFDRINVVDFMTRGHTVHARRKYKYDASHEISRDVLKSLPMFFLTSIAGALLGVSTMGGTINIASVLYDLMTATINFSNGWAFVGAKNTEKHISVFNNKRTVVLKYKKSIAH
jgi:hypothetical protein